MFTDTNKWTMTMVLTASVGCGADKNNSMPKLDDIDSPFTVTFDTFGGVPYVSGSGEAPCFATNRLSMTETKSEVVSFCFPLDADRIIYRMLETTTTESLAALFQLLGDPVLKGDIDVGANSSVADDTAFTLALQSSSKSFSVKGYLSSEAISPSLNHLLSYLNDRYGEIAAAGRKQQEATSNGALTSSATLSN